MEIWRGFKRASKISEISGVDNSECIPEISDGENLVIHLNHVPVSLALLKEQEEYCSNRVRGDILKDHFTSLEHGLEFLDFFLDVSTNEYLKQRVRDLAASVKQKLDMLTYEHEDHQILATNWDQVYAALRGEMKSVLIKPGTDREWDALFSKVFTVMYDFKKTNDFVLDKMGKLLTSIHKAGQIAPLTKGVVDLGKMLISLKPLYTYVAGFYCLSLKDEEEKLLATLTALLEKATHLIYMSFVGKMDEEMVLLLQKSFSKIIGETGIREIYLMTLSADFSGPFTNESDPYRLLRLIRLLESNGIFLNDANAKLYEELRDIRTFLSGLEENLRSKKHYYFQASFEALLGHSIYVICLYYDDHIEEDRRRELNSVLSDIFELIKHIKSEALEMKLYYYPKTDGLGFLDFFSGYLKELENRREISTNLKNVIAEINFEVSSLISSVKLRTQEKLSEALWTRIIQLAYQAEYVIDLSVGRGPINRSKNISYLCNIVEKLKPIREEVEALSYKNLAAEDVDSVTLRCEVSGMPTSVNNNDVVVGFQKEVTIVMEYLLGGEHELDISIVGMPGIGKTTLASSLHKTPQIARHFDILAWCTVSQSYEKRDLLLTILDQANQLDDSIKHLDDQELADHLYRSLRQHRYLIILDDIWETAAWNYLKRYLPNDMQGSRVLVTTRYQAVALKIKSKVHELCPLTKEESWELLQKKLPKKRSLSESLLNIGYAIAENCKGLPLSIVIIAGLLSDVEKTEEKWNEIAECNFLCLG